MAKLVLEGFMDVAESDLADVLSELPKHIALTREEEGCLVFRVERDRDHHLRFLVYEEFVSRTAFEAHQERVKASRWGSITANAKRNYSISEA